MVEGVGNMNKIPKLDEFTMGGLIAVKERIIDDSGKKELLWSQRSIDKSIERAELREVVGYKRTTPYLYEALDDWPVENHDSLVLGSASPHYEGILLARGVRRIVTVDYRKITCPDPRIITTTTVPPVLVNSVLSVSSIEHSGMGRYGDAIDPDADLKIMSRLLEVTMPAGLFFLSVPIADKDQLVWNAGRIYGPIRLPVLLKGWVQVAEYGHDAGQPVIVLRKPLE